MTADTDLPSPHFTKAVVALGDRRAIVAHQAIFNAQGVKIVEKGTRIHTGLYEKLTAHRLQTPIDHALTAEDPVNGMRLRQGMQAQLFHHAFYARMAPQASVRDTWLDVLEKLPLPAPISLQLTLARESQPELFGHSLRAAWTMAWLVSGPLNLRFDLGMAMAVGLLHDLGMLHLDPALLDAHTTLDRAQRRQLYSHPILSTTLIERHHEYPKEVVRAILEHHECLNGSGYPRNLTEQQISPLGRAIALTEAITAMVGGEHQGGELRLSVLLRMNMHRYDRAMISRVMGFLQPALDPGSEHTLLLDQPTERLRAIDAALRAWPRDADQWPGTHAQRREGMAVVQGQLAQLRRSLAEAGLAPEQLDQLEPALASADDPLLPRELSLLAAEAAWQLRTLARQARRRWRASAHEALPPALHQWLADTDRLCHGILSQMDGHDDDSE